MTRYPVRPGVPSENGWPMIGRSGCVLITAPGAGRQVPVRAGDVATVQVTYGAPHHLVADGALSGGPYAVRRTRGGDAWEATQDNPVPGRPTVSLGLPGMGAPPRGTDAASPGCR